MEERTEVYENHTGHDSAIQTPLFSCNFLHFFSCASFRSRLQLPQLTQYFGRQTDNIHRAQHQALSLKRTPKPIHGGNTLLVRLPDKGPSSSSGTRMPHLESATCKLLDFTKHSLNGISSSWPSIESTVTMRKQILNGPPSADRLV